MVYLSKQINPLIDETELQLRNITCDSYQIKICPTYIREHTVNEKFELFVHAEDKNLIRIKKQMRDDIVKHFNLNTL